MDADFAPDGGDNQLCVLSERAPSIPAERRIPPGGRDDECGHRDGKGRSERDVRTHRVRAANIRLLRNVGLLWPGRAAEFERARLFGGGALERPGRSRSGLGMRQSAGHRRTAAWRARPGPGKWRGLRCIPRSQAGRRHGLGDWRRHDAGDDREGPWKHLQDRSAERRVPARRD